MALALTLPNGEPLQGKLILVHACCAPCSSAVLECLLQNGALPTVFYSNPNIYPKAEYDHRLEELRRYLAALNIPLVEDVWDHDVWLEEVRGLEREPERGARCFRCFSLRLSRAVRYAANQGFQWVTSTLTSSRWKSIEQIGEAGRLQTCALASGDERSPVQFWNQNWRKGGLQQRRNELLKENGFYNQTYCGCEFSMNHEPVAVQSDVSLVHEREG